MGIEDLEVKKLHDKEIYLVKVVWRGPTSESVTWELESQMRDSYRLCFLQVIFEGEDSSKWGRVLTPRVQLIDLI